MAYPFPIQWQTSTPPGVVTQGPPGLSGTAAAPAPAAQAERAIRGMRGSLRRWLKVRRRMDDYVAGRRPAAGLLRNPGARPLPPKIAALNLRRDRLADEQDLANTIFALLVESGADGSSLPQPNVAVDPDAAVKLAEIATSGKLPTEAMVPSAQGILWLIAIPVAGAVLIVSQLISSKAALAELKEENRCKESGGCTDTGFWLKVASIGVIGWLAWDKMGIREAVQRRFKKT